MDEPESIAGLSLAAREGLDNLTFVVNCNLQRLDGPVRGNGKIIQELEGLFRGAGWNVIKVVWGREWDDLLARDVDGVLVEQMNDTLDGEFQKYAVSGGAYIREHFFGPDPRLRRLVEHLSDEDLEKLRRGGHDQRKVYAAYKAATEYVGAPTVVLAHTIKGWTLGPGVEARNITHQAKKLSETELKIFRDRLQLPIPDADLKDAPYYHPGPDSEEVRYLRERRVALGGSLPKRVVRAKLFGAVAPTVDAEFAGGSATPVSTTMVFARILRNLIRDPELGSRIVPIVPDEARTFGLDPLFKEVGIYAALGQRYEPVDSNLVLSYREARDGQVLEEGITEAGSMASFTAAATAYATQGLAMIPFYIFYSMFGFQRTGDQAWALGDARGRGFMMGATAGRTTLHGEGLQHDDGHSQLLASTVPSVRAYDPAYAYELAAIVRDGIERMYVQRRGRLLLRDDLQRELPDASACPTGVGDGIVRGLYRFAGPPDGVAGKGGRVRLVGSGSILQQVVEAQAILGDRFDVAAEVYSAPSFQQLRRDAHRRRSVEPAPSRRRSPGCRTSRQILGDGRRAGDHRLGLAEGGPGSRPAVAPGRHDRARDRGLRPERHPREPPRPVRDRCGRTSPRPPCRAWPGRARCPPSGPPRAFADLGHRPRQDRPARPLSRGEHPMKRTIAVNGTGRAATVPDVADVRLGVGVSRKTVAEARTKAAEVGNDGPCRADRARDRAIGHPDRIARRPARVRLQGRGPAAPRAVGQPPVRRHRARPREARPRRRRRPGRRRDDPRRGGIPDGRSRGGSRGRPR